MGRVTEARETWSLLVPKCVTCQAPHLPHQMAAVCEEGPPTSGGRRQQGLGAVGGLGSRVREVGGGQGFRDREKSARNLEG